MVLSTSSLDSMDTEPGPSCVDPAYKTTDQLANPGDAIDFEGVCMYNAAEAIGESSCVDGESVCTWNGWDEAKEETISPPITIGDNACRNYDNACYHNMASVGSYSW